MSGHKKSGTSPVRLRPDTLTPPSRTPWGGRRIRALKGLGDGPPVGESWELSVEPSFPSRTESGERLCDRIATEPRSWLGPEASAGGTSLLVKLLDAASPLSVQIHPEDGDPRLGPDESGKPETWYVVEADPGAGLYLGLAEGVDEARLREALASGEDVSRLLPFVEVAPGDFFVIEAGTPHCIGPGVFLVEPQRVRPGRRGVTYRYWDWNRRYDPEGRPAPDGAPRALHVEEAIGVTRWDLPRGEALLARVRRRAGPPCLDGAPCVDALSPDGASTPLSVSRLCGSGRAPLPDAGRLRALTVLSGRVAVDGLSVDAGRTAAVPAAWEGEAQLERAHAVVSACH